MRPNSNLINPSFNMGLVGTLYFLFQLTQQYNLNNNLILPLFLNSKLRRGIHFLSYTSRDDSSLPARARYSIITRYTTLQHYLKKETNVFHLQHKLGEPIYIFKLYITTLHKVYIKYDLRSNPASKSIHD